MSPKFLFLFFIVLLSYSKCDESDLVKYLKSFIQKNLPNEIFIHVVEIFRNQEHTFPENYEKNKTFIEEIGSLVKTAEKELIKGDLKEIGKLM